MHGAPNLIQKEKRKGKKKNDDVNAKFIADFASFALTNCKNE